MINIENIIAHCKFLFYEDPTIKLDKIKNKPNYNIVKLNRSVNGQYNSTKVRRDTRISE